MQKYYITTPIYYPSGKLHIGNAYPTVAADVMARYKRLLGFDVMYLTGTDEHGQKIEDRAKAKGVSPKQFVDEMVEGPGGIQELWKQLNISHDRFIRTTDDYHEQAVQKIFKQLYDKGEIYKSVYRGKYCTPCESFWTDSQLVDGKCPDCGRDVKDAEEEAYFFRLSKYADRILELYAQGFLQPESRVNEMVNNFIKPGLEDLCVSRTSFSWGVPVDFDPKHVVYVWIDALFNYMTALGFLNDRHNDLDKYWPADVHFVGKEIVRFHAIIWPAFLMALNLPLPKKVYGHGWLLLDGGKMSKSKGHVIDPVALAGRYGVDALRYFLLREFPFGADGNYSNEILISRINADLANDLGNLVSRTVAMAEKYFPNGIIPERQAEPVDDELIDMARGLRSAYEERMEGYAFQSALGEVFRVIARANKYIDQTSPWALKTEADRPRLASVIYNLLEAVRICSVLLTPFMPESAVKIQAQINAGTHTDWASAAVWGALPIDVKVCRGETLFPRIDLQKELAELAQSAEKAKADSAGQGTALIGIDDFAKVKMQVAKVLHCENVKKSERLLRFELDFGDHQRQVLSGIAKWYKPEQLIGHNVVVVSNLKPAKIMGLESNGMILSASNGDSLTVILADDAEPGAYLG